MPSPRRSARNINDIGSMPLRLEVGGGRRSLKRRAVLRRRSDRSNGEPVRDLSRAVDNLDHVIADGTAIFALGAVPG